MPLGGFCTVTVMQWRLLARALSETTRLPRPSKVSGSFTLIDLSYAHRVFLSALALWLPFRCATRLDMMAVGDTIAAAKPAKRQKTAPAEPQPVAEIDPEEPWSLAAWFLALLARPILSFLDATSAEPWSEPAVRLRCKSSHANIMPVGHTMHSHQNAPCGRQTPLVPTRPDINAAADSSALSLQVRQPWADKDVAPAILNEEQEAYLAQVAKEKAEKAEEEGDKGPKVRMPLSCYRSSER